MIGIARIEQATPLAIAKWTGDRQRIKACEEMAELTVELCKNVNGVGVTEKTIDEIVDVIIMANQMRILYGIDAVDARLDFKLSRLETILGIKT
jgi:hypothetical protein